MGVSVSVAWHVVISVCLTQPASRHYTRGSGPRPFGQDPPAYFTNASGFASNLALQLFEQK